MNDIQHRQFDAEAERIAALRMQMLEMHPFWGYLLLQMQLIPAPTLPTLAVTDMVRHIWYNPRLTVKLNARELGFVLAHEICHQVLENDARRGAREPFKWNMATDYAINAIISDIPVPGASGWGTMPLYQRPEGTLFHPKYRDWIAEVIYEDLCRKELKIGSVTIELELPDAEGKLRRLPELLDHHGGIDIHLPLELDTDQREILRERLLAAVENFHANADRGDLPDSQLRQLGLLEEPRIPWRRLLHRYANAALNAGDYSLARPNKHYLEHDLIVPGRYSESISSIVVSLDTSGSMTEKELREVAAEIRGLLPDAQEITLIVADCDIQQVIPFDQLEDALKKAEFYGGGGTDHHCVFAYIAEHRLRPALFIGLSDLYSSFPEKKPPYPVLWVVPETHGDPPWGKVIPLH